MWFLPSRHWQREPLMTAHVTGGTLGAREEPWEQVAEGPTVVPGRREGGQRQTRKQETTHILQISNVEEKGPQTTRTQQPLSLPPTRLGSLNYSTLGPYYSY